MVTAMVLHSMQNSGFDLDTRKVSLALQISMCDQP
jgi:hypothetical protein